MLAWLVLVAVLAHAARVSAQTRPTCPDTVDVRCQQSASSVDSHQFTIQGIFTKITFQDSKSLKISCQNATAETQPLDERNVPAFESGLHVSSVTVERCPAPLRSYGDLLDSIGVRFWPSQRALLHVDTLSGAASLTRGHFAGLSTLTDLQLEDAGPLPVAFLQDLPLKSLIVAFSTILQSKFDTMSKSFDENSTLTYLSLEKTNLSRVPAAVLALPALDTLNVKEDGTVKLEETPDRASPLRTLYVDAADEAVMSEWTPPAQDVTLVRWAAQPPFPIPACQHLRHLTLLSPRTATLPERWVSACSTLEKLEVEEASIPQLPATLLANASSLRVFRFQRCKLTSLPHGLFTASPNLTTVDLTDNLLHALPSGVFHFQRAVLTELRLSANRLTAALLTVGFWELPALTTLVLSHNADITDNCGGDPIREGHYVETKGESGLSNLTNLKHLDLSYTSVRAVCTDWRVKLTHLKVLDLRNTKISRLSRQDLQFSWSDVDERSEVRLEHTPLEQLEYGPDDRSTSRAHVVLGGREARLPCDCRTYWAAVDLTRGQDASLWCGATSPRELVPPYLDTLLCERTAECEGVPEACHCGTRPLPSNRTLLRVNCTAAGLHAVPRVSTSRNVTVELQLAGNDITVLQLADLPHNITSLDLRNNTLKRVEEKAALALEAAAARGGRVLVGGGRFVCDCDAAPALRALLRLAPRPALTCDTGEHVESALAALRCNETSTAPSVLGATLAVLALLAVLGGALLAYPATRRRVKELLRSCRAEKPRQFDLFLTFGAGCERLALEVAGRLEPRYAVCLQERDWVPPAHVAACLAQSVAASRRTLALASARWAAALDEQSAEGAALAAALRSRRLLAVLLEPPPAGALRRYLARHPRAALHYADPDFWRKLSAALPPPAPAPPDRAELGSNG